MHSEMQFGPINIKLVGIGGWEGLRRGNGEVGDEGGEKKERLHRGIHNAHCGSYIVPHAPCSHGSKQIHIEKREYNIFFGMLFCGMKRLVCRMLRLSSEC